MHPDRNEGANADVLGQVHLQDNTVCCVSWAWLSLVQVIGN